MEAKRKEVAVLSLHRIRQQFVKTRTMQAHQVRGLLEGEKLAVLCREFDISRKTGYKIFARYQDCGLEGLTDRSRRPYRHANRLPCQIETRIVQLKKEHPSWGAPT
jgi:putative transposase